jgi:hypothetical protein
MCARVHVLGRPGLLHSAVRGVRGLPRLVGRRVLVLPRLLRPSLISFSVVFSVEAEDTPPPPHRYAIVVDPGSGTMWVFLKTEAYGAHYITHTSSIYVHVNGPTLDTWPNRQRDAAHWTDRRTENQSGHQFLPKNSWHGICTDGEMDLHLPRTASQAPAVGQKQVGTKQKQKEEEEDTHRNELWNTS